MSELIVVGANLVFAGASMAVWVSLGRRGVNGACRLCLVLLLAQRVSDVRLGAATLTPGPELWHWGLGALFGFVFLYVLHHTGVLIAEARRVSASAGETPAPRGDGGQSETGGAGAPPSG